MAVAGIIVALLVAAAPARADEVARWRAHIAEASARFGIPAIWIERVMRAESAGLTSMNGRPIISRAGALGLMQLMPPTWSAMRARLNLGHEPHNPRDNILAGTLYLRLMYDQFGYPGLFGAYNAGPRRYADYLAARRRLPAETRAYLAKVGGAADALPVAADPPRPAMFFAVRGPAHLAAVPETPARNGLFFVLNRPEPLP